MILKLIKIDSPENCGNVVQVKGLEQYLVDVTKGEDTYTYIYDTNSEDVEVEPNQLFYIFVKTILSTTDEKEVFKFYLCELSETEKSSLAFSPGVEAQREPFGSCETWSLTGYCFGNFKVLFETEGIRVTERLQKWWGRTTEPTVKLAKAIALDELERSELS